MTSEQMTCIGCGHLRTRPLPALPADAHAVGLAKGLLRFHQLREEIASREEMLVATGQALDYEPMFHPWCAHVSSPAARVWWTCETENSDGRCPANTVRASATRARNATTR